MAGIYGRLSPLEVDLLALFEFLYENGGTRSPNDLSAFDYPRGSKASLVRNADETGHVTLDEGAGRLANRFPRVLLNLYGVRYVEEVRAMRDEPIERKRACRIALLRWIYDHGGQHVPTSGFLTGDPRITFFGLPFTEEEVGEAGRYLTDAGLLNGRSGWQANGLLVAASLSARGTECVEEYDADIRAFVARGAAPVGPTFHQNFHGPFTGQAAQGVNVVQNQHGLDGEALRVIFEKLRAPLPDVADAEDREDLAQAIDDLERAVSIETVDASEVERRAGILRRLARRVGGTMLDTATSGATDELLDLLGGGL